MKSGSRSGHLKYRRPNRSPLDSHVSMIATRPHLQRGRSFHGGRSARFNRQSALSWLPEYESWLPEAIAAIVEG